MKMKFDFAGFKFEKIQPARIEMVTIETGKEVESHFNGSKENFEIEKISLEMEYSVEEFIDLVKANNEMLPVMLDFIRKMK